MTKTFTNAITSAVTYAICDPENQNFGHDYLVDLIAEFDVSCDINDCKRNLAAELRRLVNLDMPAFSSEDKLYREVMTVALATVNWIEVADFVIGEIS